MAIEDFEAVVRVLADPEVLQVFAAVAAGDSGREPTVTATTRSVSYTTVFGLVRKTGLQRDVVEAAAERLVGVGLLEVMIDSERGYGNWRVDTAALAALV